jgi:hypothetical protein
VPFEEKKLSAISLRPPSPVKGDERWKRDRAIAAAIRSKRLLTRPPRSA